ncbi:hypothetical protein LGR54_14410 [Ancylobacter sp. Lp-2]|uniref:hypothetical protein n=1 Tax=Ancylobacter sp. Lp-2 TaxID=2881339 RepID=UPI001E54F735|nr:hypothetical protein [Ancylobacter sp. Lp-2]MCB4769808.1 hypothetical protein [Ancylobacter sp. Lp-2]
MTTVSMLQAERRRHDLGGGRGGDKVSFPDPATVPLGTDEEAAGAAPSPAPARARAAAIRPRDGMAVAVTDAAAHGDGNDRDGGTPLPFIVRVIVWLAALVVLGGLVVAWLR